jgi:hypothetical protein
MVYQVPKKTKANLKWNVYKIQTHFKNAKTEDEQRATAKN